GKERGYLTYAEINDHLPDDMLDAEQIENIISMINDMGIQVYDEAPDAETLLMSDAAPAVTDEDAVEEAEAALSTVDSEFGRTTDPVRMYMREMGSVELLTREGEIEIAKRIEDGLRHMILAISACPTTIAEMLSLADRIEKDEMRVDEVVDGFHDTESEEVIEEVSEDDEEMEEELEASDAEDDEGAAAAVQTANLLKLKEEALKRFGLIRRHYDRMMKGLAKTGPRSKPFTEARDEISEELMRTTQGWGVISYNGGTVSTTTTTPRVPYFYQATITESGAKDVNGNPLKPLIVSSSKSYNIELNDTITWENFDFNLGVLISKDELYGQGLRPKAGTVSGYELAPGNKYKMYTIDWKDMIQPRLGVTWRYDGSNTVFANVASYNPEASSLSRAASWDRNLFSRVLDIRFDQNGNFLESVYRGASSGKVFASGMKPRRVDELTLGTTRQVSEGWALRGHVR
ncbi:MAG: hypothetical protein EBT64_08935, partial [Gammaproteobacteria bacterium]|nr:hypothetical protein [Gammaproteobacteria bacterium]